MIAERAIDVSGIGSAVSIPQVDLVDFFSGVEGTLELYYGHIRNGKTYSATADMLDDLRRGRSVWTNYPVNFEGLDERRSPFLLIMGIVFPFIKRYKYIKKENLRVYEISDTWAQKQGYSDFWDWFTKLTDCVVYADEGHVLLDSYRKTYVSMEQRNAVLQTGHFNRTIKIISQRPTAVHVTARGNINIFWKCEKLLSWPFLLFRRTEFQDMIMETVDETKPLSTKIYWGSKKIMKAYDSKYLRKGAKTSQDVNIEVYELNVHDKVLALGRVAAAFMPRLRFNTRKDNTRKSLLKDKIPFVEREPNWGRPPFRYPKGGVAKEKAIKTEAGSILSTSAEDNDKTMSLPF